MANDVFDHLLDIENQAADLLLNAQTEADKRLSDARNVAEDDYKKQYEALVAELEADFHKTMERMDLEHVADIDSFQKEICNFAQDIHSFNTFLHDLLFEA